ncbi:MAG: polyprenyl synthetase family protein, partial [Chloroflexales bacterium]|nr:polyprenyl synthetase family protein [Chloroflexales bacterium]
MTQFPLPPGLADDLQHVEQILQERTHSRAAVISVAGARLLSSGAARVRAALVLMAAQTGTYQRDQAAHAAAAIELIHAATQTHDDLIDEAERRRGAPRVGEWGHGVALMVGDYLFALAAGEMSLSPDPRVIGFYSQAVTRITEETLAPPVAPRPLEEARARYLERLAGTAAALYSAACKAGGACGAAPTEQIEALGRFGHNLGLALRLGDEAHDFAPR